MNQIINKISAVLSENSTAILTAGGVVGTVTTAVLAGRAGLKAGDRLVGAAMVRAVDPETPGDDPGVPKWEQVKLAAPYFIPPALTCAATVGAVIMAHRLSASRAAALAAAYAVSENSFKEYKEKVSEKLGVNKSQKVRDEIAQGRVDNHPLDKSVVIIGNGEVLCYDAYSDRYFKSTVEKIRQAEAAVQAEILTSNECSLGFFYDELGLPLPAVSNDVGWNINRDCTVTISATVSQGNEPCIVIQFEDLPVFEYGTSY